VNDKPKPTWEEIEKYLHDCFQSRLDDFANYPMMDQAFLKGRYAECRMICEHFGLDVPPLSLDMA
jgi:hypothetical protein